MFNIGRSLDIIEADFSEMSFLLNCLKSATTSLISTASIPSVGLLVLEYCNRSRMICFILLAPSVAKWIYLCPFSSSRSPYFRCNRSMKLEIILSGSCKSWEATKANCSSSSLDRSSSCVCFWSDRFSSLNCSVICFCSEISVIAPTIRIAFPSLFLIITPRSIT